MKKTGDEKSFLNELQQHYKVILLNETKHNIKNIIDKLSVCDPPDYVFGEHYIEKFEVDHFKRCPAKSGKMVSLHKNHNAQLQKRVKKSQDFFRAVHYSSPEKRSNIQYLKTNIEDLIENKTGKQSIYEQIYPRVKYKHLMIELKCRCNILTDEKGNYLNEFLPKESLNNLHPVEYEVFRDFNFINKIKQRYSDKWDLLIFVDRFQDLDELLYYLYCFDLKKNIDLRKMKKYPDKPLQIVEGRQNVLKMQKGVSATNIKYRKEDVDSSLKLIDVDTIKLENTIMRRHEYLDSVYISEDYGFLFESSQLVCAINPDVCTEIISQYIPLLLRNKMTLALAKKTVTLTRITSIEEFFYRKDKQAYYKINRKTWLNLTNKLNIH